MILKLLILTSFLNLVLTETFAHICVENKETIKYENILNDCYNNQNTAAEKQNRLQCANHDFLNSTDNCCIDYNQLIQFVTGQDSQKSNIKIFSNTVPSLNEFRIENTNCQNQIFSSTSPNILILSTIKLMVLRI